MPEFSVNLLYVYIVAALCKLCNVTHWAVHSKQMDYDHPHPVSFKFPNASWVTIIFCVITPIRDVTKPGTIRIRRMRIS